MANHLYLYMKWLYPSIEQLSIATQWLDLCRILSHNVSLVYFNLKPIPQENVENQTIVVAQSIASCFEVVQKLQKYGMYEC